MKSPNRSCSPACALINSGPTAFVQTAPQLVYPFHPPSEIEENLMGKTPAAGLVALMVASMAAPSGSALAQEQQAFVR